MFEFGTMLPVSIMLVWHKYSLTLWAGITPFCLHSCGTKCIRFVHKTLSLHYRVREVILRISTSLSPSYRC